MSSPSRAQALCLVAFSLSMAGSTQAAEVTRTASAFDPGNPFDLDLQIGFERTQRRGLISREVYRNGSIEDVPELRYTAITQEMPMRVAVGLFHDLELHGGGSLVFNDDQSWWFSAAKNDDGTPKVTPATSTILNNCVTPRGDFTDPTCTATGKNAQPIFSVPAAGITSHHAGFRNVYVGVSWAPLSDERDESKPKWILSFDYTAPSASVSKPWLATSTSDRGPMGDGAHRFTFSTALSKRLGPIDPYVKLTYTLPVVAGMAISNCQNATALGYGQNCGVGPWNRAEGGYKPSHVGGFLFGAEVYPYDSRERQQRVSVDLQLGALYVSEGRTYNELSDVLGKLLYTEEYIVLGGAFGVNARFAQYVQLKLNASLYTNTAHFLTNEPVGKDVNGNAVVDLNTTEMSPSFDARYDVPGRRFRLSEVSVFTVMATGMVNF